MEPVKGGYLANPPREVRERFAALRPQWSPSSWALRWVAGLPGVSVVLSGMSAMAQVEDNLSTFKPEGEHAAVAVAAEDIKAAIQAHREAGKGGAKNLLMPKPKPVEDKPRHGQRQRKPAPKARRRS